MKKTIFIFIFLLMFITTFASCKKKNQDNENNKEPEHVHEYKLVNEVAATCTESGVKAHYTCEGCDKIFDENKNETTLAALNISALNHSWDEPTYEWNADNSACTATRVCKNDASHVETETVNAEETHVDSGCVVDGKNTYTATFTNKAFEKQEREYIIDHYGHSWGYATYTWSADYSKCTATRVCNNDANHVETETVDSKSRVMSEATEEHEGAILYEATFTNEAFIEQSEVVMTPQLPTLSKISFTLVEDSSGAYYSVKAASSSISGSLVIPETYNDKPVTKIDAAGFEGTAITEVVIPASVTCVETYAFHNCTKLVEVKFIDGAKSCEIGMGAFKDCSKLERFTLPSSLTEIESHLFNGCTSLSYIDLKYLGKLEEIGNSAFDDCSNISFLYLPGSIKTISDHALGDSKKLSGFYYNGTQEDWSKVVVRPHGLPDTATIIVCTDGQIVDYMVPEE